jgi:hypothetical protein
LLKGSLKSLEEIYLRLHAQLVRCDPLKLCTSGHKSFVRDIQTLESRTQNEGLAFLTKTLPKLGAALDRGLTSGRFDIPREFRTQRNDSRPAFLQVYFNLVFDEHGFLLEEPSVMAIRHLRQVLFFAYKLKLPFSEKDNHRVIDGFVQTDKELKSIDNPLAVEIISLAKIITRKVFHDFNHRDIRPRHGPGAVATGEKGDGKWVFSRLYDSIHQVYPYYEYYIVGGGRELTDRLDWYKSLHRHKSGCAKVVLVPKDSRGPRLISCEPLEYQWIQQGLGRKLAFHLERLSPITKGRINFTDQEVNSSLAKSSSATQNYATLDLKDASDRVSLGLVRSVFESTPNLARALEACRTTETRLPNGRVITLNKFAPMGSALCFPVESFIFWVIIVSAVIIAKNLPLNVVGKRVFVYGDDIVVPTDWALLSIQALESVGLMVNESKSCFTGFFRESCGVDAYKGVDVTPLRLRTLWPNQTSDGSALAAYTSLANSFACDVYKPLSELIWMELVKVYGEIPYGTYRSSYPCRIVDSPLQAETLNRSKFRWRFNRNIQRVEFFLPSLSSRRLRSRLDGWTRLLRDLISPPVGDPSTMVLPFSMKIKKGWTSVT